MQQNSETLRLKLEGLRAEHTLARHERGRLGVLVGFAEKLVEYCRVEQPVIEVYLPRVPEPTVKPKTWFGAATATLRAMALSGSEKLSSRFQTVTITMMLEALRKHLADRELNFSEKVAGLKHDIALIKTQLAEEKGGQDQKMTN
jgi:hypothetical protein